MHRAYLARGYCQEKLGSRDEAMRDYEAAIKSDPASAIAFCYRGRLRGELGKEREALADFRDAISVDPDSATVYLYRGDYLRTIGDNKPAMDDYKTAADLYRDQGKEDKYKEAMKNWEELFALPLSKSERDNAKRKRKKV